MAQILDIFAFVTVLLRGIALAFEALTVGGVIFFLAIARQLMGRDAFRHISRWLRCVSILLALTYALVMALNSIILVKSAGLHLADIVGASFVLGGALVVAGAAAIVVFATSRWLSAISPLAVVSIVAGSVMSSHSVARLDHRSFLIMCTLGHHLASAAWIGGLPYLLVSLRKTPDPKRASSITARFSRLAMASVALLIGAGISLAFLYVRSGAALVGTTYGIMLMAKVILTGAALLLGAMNLKIVRAVRMGLAPSMLPLQRFAEAEIGIGFTLLLAAASLTSTPPAIDVAASRVSLQQIGERMKPRWPSLQTPAISELSPAIPLSMPENSRLPGSFVPGQLRQPNRPADIAWSEYNHHWAGLIVLTIGILATFSRRFSWARHWPVAFLGLAVFLLVRADSESWPLGPRGFWESFQVAEVAQHRLFVPLIVAFAMFEWAVQTRRLSPGRAGLVFPLVCAAGGTLLLTHSHSLGNVKDEFLAELSHIPLAIAGVMAGWSRWIEIRLPTERPRLIGWIWPVCFVIIGAFLILYRES